MVRQSEITLSKAVEGFLLHKAAEGKSRHTLSDYRVSLNKLLEHAGDIPLRQLGIGRLRNFFAYLNDGYTTTPAGIAPRPEQALSQKTIRNIHAAVSSMFTWAISEGYAKANPMSRIQRPKGEPPPIEPLSQADIVALMQAAAETTPWKNRPGIRTQRPTADRDQAIILTLLDTGLRASELCSLTTGDFNQSTGHIQVLRGKGKKSRTVRASDSTRRAIWRYLASRGQLADDAPLFATSQNGHELHMSRYALGRLLERMGERAKVRNVHPHRFRHTFAIEYLRNNGDIYTLQQILGHSTLDMVKKYLHIAQADLDTKHKSASPVRNWRL
jgi:integrase/recombinase XerD